MTSTPQVAQTRQQLVDALAATSGQVGFVPTMGALHDGHASLMRRAREEIGRDGALVVSIFVNPMQFGEGEDLDRYPRTLDEDLKVCSDQGVDVVFAPSVDEVYPAGKPEVTIKPGPKAKLLEGKTRKGHFHGVLTVVAKLFGLVQPDIAVFGQKDYQQLVLIRQMVQDLCMPVRIIGAETHREPDGLALSSRNRYLDEDSRRAATGISQALFEAARAGVDGPKAVIDTARAQMRQAQMVDLDYLELTAPDLGPAPQTGPARLLIAARVGTTRLIDNVAVHLGPEQ